MGYYGCRQTHTWNRGEDLFQQYGLYFADIRSEVCWTELMAFHGPYPYRVVLYVFHP